MRSQTSVFFGTIVVLLAVNGVKSLPLSLTKKQTPHTVNTLRDKTVVLNCNVNHDSCGIGEAIKALEERIDHLIALVNETSPRQRALPPGKLTVYLILIFVYCNFLDDQSFEHFILNYVLFSVQPRLPPLHARDDKKNKSELFNAVNMDF